MMLVSGTVSDSAGRSPRSPAASPADSAPSPRDMLPDHAVNSRTSFLIDDILNTVKHNGENGANIVHRPKAFSPADRTLAAAAFQAKVII